METISINRLASYDWAPFAGNTKNMARKTAGWTAACGVVGPAFWGYVDVIYVTTTFMN